MRAVATDTEGPTEDAQVLKYAGTPDELPRLFQGHVVRPPAETIARIFVPGEPLIVTE